MILAQVLGILAQNEFPIFGETILKKVVSSPAPNETIWRLRESRCRHPVFWAFVTRIVVVFARLKSTFRTLFDVGKASLNRFKIRSNQQNWLHWVMTSTL